MREGQYQSKLISTIKELFPDCVVIKNDANYIQGIPDILLLFPGWWAMLEIKMDALSPVQPNQEYYVKLFNEMSFAAFINPETETEVLYAIQRAYGARR